MSDELDQGFADLMSKANQSAKEGLLPARFFVEPIKDEAKSSEAGRAVFVDTEMVEIRIDRDLVRRPIRDQDRADYAAQYAMFKRGQDQSAAEGTPLREWPLVTRSMAEEFAFCGIRSVEHLAAASDTMIQRVGPHMALRQKARDWLAAAKENALLAKLRDENTSLRDRLAALERMVETQRMDIDKARANGGTLPGANGDDRFKALEAQIAALATKAAEPKRRGRPPKNATTE